MTRLKGIDAAVRLTTRRPEVRIPCLTAHTEPSYARAMLTSGASGNLKHAGRHDELVPAVRVVAGRQSYLCPEVADMVVESLRAATHCMRPRNRVRAPGRREREALQLAAEGQATADIAD